MSEYCIGIDVLSVSGVLSVSHILSISHTDIGLYMSARDIFGLLFRPIEMKATTICKCFN